MTDPLGLASSGSVPRPVGPLPTGAPGAPARPGEAGGEDFKAVFKQSIEKVHRLQQDASHAVEDMQAGRRNDVSNVLMAQKKAEVAFELLMQVRNKMVDAYEEIKQMRV